MREQSLRCVLTVDQGMIMAAIANELAEDAMRHAFSDGRIEQAIRPLIAMEEFSVGLPVQLIGAKPTVVGSQAGGKRRDQVSTAGSREPPGWSAGLDDSPMAVD